VKSLNFTWLAVYRSYVKGRHDPLNFSVNVFISRGIV
jgi:hypothetical protein